MKKTATALTFLFCGLICSAQKQKQKSESDTLEINLQRAKVIKVNNNTFTTNGKGFVLLLDTEEEAEMIDAIISNAKQDMVSAKYASHIAQLIESQLKHQ